MRQFAIVLWRELSSSFGSRLILWGGLIFPVLAASMTFYLGHFFESNQATLKAFFAFHPWLYLFFLPVLTMGGWVEEQQSGSIHLLMTLPITVFEAVSGKFVCAWIIAGLALLLTSPMVWTVNYLGEPDNGAIVAGYLGSWLLAGVFLAVGGCASAMMNNQLSAYVLAIVLCFLFLICGFPKVLEGVVGWAGQGVTDAIAAMSLLNFFERICRGALDAQGLLFFLSLIGAWLAVTVAVVKLKKVA